MGEFQNIVLWLAGGAALCVGISLFLGRFCGMTSAPKYTFVPADQCGQCGYIRPGEWQCNCESPPCKVLPHERTDEKKIPSDKPTGRRAAIEATKAKIEARNAT